MTVLALDPGKNIGRALWTDHGVLLFKDSCDFDTLLSYLVEGTMTTIVYEDWRLFKRQNQQTGSKMEASQVIGAIKLWRLLKAGREIHAQSPNILPVSALHIGITLPRGHLADNLSAMLHGHYWLVEQGILAPHAID